VTARCSIVIPVHNRAGLTRKCLDALLPGIGNGTTPALLSGYGPPVRVIRRESNGGFAVACNEGAAGSGAEFVVFLNNDTVPLDGWLDALVRYADANPAAAVIGSKLLFPNDTVQHAGVVICQDSYPRHIYAGFPAAHPAVNRSRRFQAVTAGCALVRRTAFEEADGFDEAFRNSLEDADLCLRLGELGHEVHYCHESVLYHLESVSRAPRSKEAQQNARLFRERWVGRARPDDLDYYVADDLLRIRYRDLYPLGFEVAGELAAIAEGSSEAGRLLEAQSRQVSDLLRETVRLTAHIAELELDRPVRGPDRPRPSGSATGDEDLSPDDVIWRIDALEIEVYELQAAIAARLARAREDRTEEAVNGLPRFTASEQLSYRKMVRQVRDAVVTRVPANATVLVISRGDDHLLELGGQAAWHFPQAERGTYSGHHPRDSRAAIEQLERLREKGADYLVIPQTAAWWLEHYDGFARHLRDRYRDLTRDGEPCRIFALHADAGEEDVD
jgi:glycosyltransferase involved in cell wall biosynthesis